MEFNRGDKKKVEHSRLQMYKTPPMQSVSVNEFEELALKRLKLLQEIDRSRQRRSRDEDHQKGSKELYSTNILKASKQFMPLSLVDSKPGVHQSQQIALTMAEKRRDLISHYILRLAYCRNEEMRRWFLSQETELLKTRFLAFVQDREAFFSNNKEDFNFEKVKSTDISNASLAKDILEFHKLGYVEGVNNDISYYLVPFTMALDLVYSRQVVLHQGYVYIPEKNAEMIVSLVCNKFRTRLSEELVKTLHHLSVVDDDERIQPLLRKLKYRYLGEDFSSVGSQVQGQIQLSQINMLSRESYPPCMRHLHETFRREHHLKHFARLQYGLFLKSIGLTLEQALAFWKAEFIKKMELDKFEKQYAYNVRHSYGKEGKRANYTAYSCVRIIMGNAPGQGDCHGCPFKHWDEQHLQQMLVAHGLSHKCISQVTSYVKDHHHQLACQKYFEITHGISTAPFSLEHPSQFFLESRKLRGSVGQVKEEPPAIKEEISETAVDSDLQASNISEQDLISLEEDMDCS